MHNIDNVLQTFALPSQRLFPTAKRSASLMGVGPGMIRMIPSPPRKFNHLTAQAQNVIIVVMKNPHAVALGSLGGKRGGPARAKTLSPKNRSEIARLGGLVKWKNRLQADRVYRRKIAEKLVKGSDIDPGDVEHSLYSLTITPTERLNRCLAFKS